MKLAVINTVRGHPASYPRLRRLLTFLLGRALRGSCCRWEDVVLVLMDDPGIQRVNRLHLGHDYTTDVITYAYTSVPGASLACLSGEIYVNLVMAQEVGSRFKGCDHELALYMAHGCDHLSGAEDGTPSLRRRMRRRELRWLAQASRLCLLDGLTRS